MSKLTVLMGVLGLLWGCTTVSEVRGPDGRLAYAIDCGTDRVECLKEAGKRCPTGYSVVDDRTGFIAVNGIAGSQTLLTVSCR